MNLFLKDGTYCLIDDEDAVRVLNYSKIWWRNADGYAQTMIRSDNKVIFVSLHRFIMNVHMGLSEVHVDHISQDKLDNRKFNLRLVNKSQNNFNVINTNPDKGAYREKRHGRWIASVVVNKKQKELGRFKTRDEAIAKVIEFENMHPEKQFLHKKIPISIANDRRKLSYKRTVSVAGALMKHRNKINKR